MGWAGLATRGITRMVANKFPKPVKTCICSQLYEDIQVAQGSVCSAGPVHANTVAKNGNFDEIWGRDNRIQPLLKGFPVKRTLVINSLVFLLALVLVTGCSGDQEQASAGDTAAHSGQAVIGANVGNLAPDFSLQDLAGGRISLSEHKGKVVLIDFWDTWCPPCRRALPRLQELSDAYAGDLVVIGVAMGRDGEAKVRSYVESNQLTFPFALADAPQYSVLRDYGGVQSLPTTFLVDREGIIRQVWTGEKPKAVYEKAVRLAMGA